MKFAAAVAAALLLTASTTPVWAAPTPDPALKQTVHANEAWGSGNAEVARGHVDIGPLLADGSLATAVRDDTVKPPVWRKLEDVVLRVNDAALLEIPADPQYGFLGLPGGKKVHVVPQTQTADVVWVGWNTQHPSLATRVKRGVTLRLQSVTGPGSLQVFLQNGFDKPQPLWTSTKTGDQDIWLDLNTHTHANWVFSEPGNYQVQFQVRGDGADGKTATSQAVVKFAVGNAASASELFAARQVNAPAPSSTPSATPVAAAQPGATWLLPAGAGAVAAGGLGLVVWWIVHQHKSARQRRDILQEKQ